ncbi:5-methyltetrahydropteroyltriglutamate--homocysteine methyltransferase [Halovenus halobia]|uniref:5-methyltetrahydropteroyltriglutamate-- homocysteine methyltransferase n=1 Tax=Halovenus halobia TaxID=3396622 RepID=UPI003F553E0D
MTEIVATTPGLYPLPDWAKEQLKDQKGNQKVDLIGGDEGEEIQQSYAEVREEFINAQQAASLDRIVEGQGRWDDMLAHPLAVNDAVDTQGIVRYYDNNNFYRDPVVTDELSASGDVADELEAATAQTDDLQAVLPGPYSLADLATDEYYGDDASFQAAIGEFLAEEADLLPDVETLFLLEPSLVENAPDDGADERASEAIDTVAAATDADVVVHPYWGALEEKVYAHVMDADIDALGFDLISDHEQNVYNAQEYGAPDDVALGIVDGQNTLVEDPETLEERIEWFTDQTQQNDYERIYATTNTETFYLPVNRFEEKLEALGALNKTEVTA